MHLYFLVGLRHVLHDGKEGISSGNILLLNQNTLSKYKFVITVRINE